MFEDERATEAALTFLRDMKVGCMVSLAPPEDEGEEESEEEEGERESEEEGPGPP